MSEVRVAVREPGCPRLRASLVADLIRSLTGFHWVGIYQASPSEVELLAWSGLPGPAHPRFPLAENLTLEAVRQAEPIVCNDVAGDPRYVAASDKVGSEVIVPVVDGDHVLGTLDVEDCRQGIFTEDLVTRLLAIAAELVPLYQEQHALD
ncbi:GAF domain-containing protein [Allokutzneria oryzae]|uniref:GAF domain-containing protein n=1 Tax=Allokutzneria oryzae TaxID=1378989 RepID=A0ABV6A4C1_9PSEU